MKLFFIMWVLALGVFAACSPTSTEGSETTMGNMTLTSSAFSDGGMIPDQYTYSLGSQCQGENFSPPLVWTGAPEGTQSFAILMTDPDGRNWVHWLQFNIRADVTSLSEAIGGPNMGVNGNNDFKEPGYGGPCPPSGTHRYIFTLYALDATLSLSEGANRAQFDAAIKGHVLAMAQLTGLRSRN